MRGRVEGEGRENINIIHREGVGCRRVGGFKVEENVNREKGIEIRKYNSKREERVKGRRKESEVSLITRGR